MGPGPPPTISPLSLGGRADADPGLAQQGHLWEEPVLLDAVWGVTYDFGSGAIDFPALGDWCRGRQGQVIVCENDGADWLPFTPFASAHAMFGTRRSGRSAEAIWTNEEM